MLFMDGDHVPIMPLFEVVGNAGMVAPAQYSVTIPVKVGVKSGFIVAVTGVRGEEAQPVVELYASA